MTEYSTETTRKHRRARRRQRFAIVPTMILEMPEVSPAALRAFVALSAFQDERGLVEARASAIAEMMPKPDGEPPSRQAVQKQLAILRDVGLVAWENVARDNGGNGICRIQILIDSNGHARQPLVAGGGNEELRARQPLEVASREQTVREQIPVPNGTGPATPNVVIELAPENAGTLVGCYVDAYRDSHRDNDPPDGAKKQFARWAKRTLDSGRPYSSLVDISVWAGRELVASANRLDAALANQDAGLSIAAPVRRRPSAEDEMGSVDPRIVQIGRIARGGRR